MDDVILCILMIEQRLFLFLQGLISDQAGYSMENNDECQFFDKMFF